ncbi:MAG: EamA family transporter [Lachnospiraceae bacterium]|nr:EamA family transporter [Lachnospiraceae bacterium]
MKKDYGVLYIFLSAVFFSMSGLLIKMVPWSSLSINGARSGLAAIVMWVYLKKTNHKLVMNKVVWIGALITLAMNLTFVYATKMTSAANAIVLQYTSPIFIILFMWMIWKQRPRRLDVITCVFVLVGVVCFFIDEISPEGMAGNLLAIFSGAMFALTYMLKTWDGADFASSVFFSQIAALVMGIPFYAQETAFAPINLICIFILGIFQLGLGFVLLAKGMETVHPVTAVLVSSIEPILNPLLVAIVLKEMIGPISLVGAAVVLVTLVIYNVIDAKKQVTTS